MRLLSVGLPLMLAAMGTAAAGETRDDMIDADRAFAGVATERGQLSAYERFLAPDAIVFRPGAVNGLEWLSGHVPATGRLEWTPVAAAVDCGGRLGLTSGPWTYVDEDGRNRATGYYLTLWRKDEHDEWLIALDHGIELPSGADDVAAIVATRLEQAWPDAERKCAHGALAQLERAERKLNATTKPGKRRREKESKPDDSLLAYRDGAAPFVATRKSIEGSGVVRRSQFTYAQNGSDMGYSYGEVVDGARPDARASGIYVRVWRLAPEGWRPVLDLLTAVPANP